MGRSANMSPLGLYNWDDTIFDLMVIPEEMDRDILIENLLAETAELEVLYPNPVVFKNLLGIWSHKQLDIWERLYATTQYEYNPIENYNRTESGSTTGNSTITHSGIDSHSDHIGTGGEDTVSGNSEDGHFVAGYDAPTPTEQSDGLFKQTRDNHEGETTTEYGKTEDSYGNVSYGHKVEDYNGGTHQLNAHGNIGVMSTQEMIRQQREIENYNLYDIIIEEFKNRFCILVY